MHENHASIVRIQGTVSIDYSFQFAYVTVVEDKFVQWDSDSSKATGYDIIPSKLVKATGNELNQLFFLSWVDIPLYFSSFPHE